ncbi:hypothetical protein SSX86_006018 [Deinandra increscens subsp. villosa]|uniref:S1 motif domain-containing protein n=1 Tax=Deinandra increscens subsp. villosa TaxID=3103831 RepID=A0AAP0DM94_9ASTR
MFWRGREREIIKDKNGLPPSGQVRVLVVGDSGVGKTSLVHLIVKGSSIARPAPTVGCTVDVKHFTYGSSSSSSSSSSKGDTDREFFVELWDVSGHERYIHCRSMFYSQINGVIFVHDLSQKRTKTSLQKWAAEIAATGTFSAPLANGGPGGLPVPYIVIGNKADITSKEGRRNSSGNLVEMARQWVEKQGLLPPSEELPLTDSFPGSGGLLAAAREARYDKESVMKFFRTLVRRRYFSDDLPTSNPWSTIIQPPLQRPDENLSDEDHIYSRTSQIGNVLPPLPAQRNLTPPPTLYPQQPVSTPENYNFQRFRAPELSSIRSKRTDINGLCGIFLLHTDSNTDTEMRGLELPLNHTQKLRLQKALESLSSATYSNASVTVADSIPVNQEDGVLKGHGTTELEGEVVATVCGVIERVNKLVYVRTLRARYKPEVGDIIVGRVIEVAPKRWRLEINFSQDAVLMLSSMNLPDGIQRRRTAVDELNMRSIFEEDDVICAEVRDFMRDGSLQLQARSQKYGKLERGQMLTISPYLVKRRKQHFHHLEQYGIDLILGCNGFIWVGEHVEIKDNMIEDEPTKPDSKNNKSQISTTLEEQEETYTTLETRQNICKIANAIRVLTTLGFSITLDVILDIVDLSTKKGLDIHEMLGAEFCVLVAEKEAERRSVLTRRKRDREFREEEEENTEEQQSATYEYCR